MDKLDKNSAQKTEKTEVNRSSEKESWGNTVRVALGILSDDQREKLAVFKKDQVSTDSLKFTVSCDKNNPFNSTQPSADKPTIDRIEVEDLTDIKDILRAIHLLINQESSNLCTQLELLIRFDELQGWRDSGSKNCAAWMNAYLQIDQRTAWERLRVGRRLRELPIIRQLFQSGRLSWSKVRLLTRIAEPDNEKILAHASIDSTVSDVQRLCEEYRWSRIDNDENDARQAYIQQEKRSLNWQKLPDGSTQIRLTLPPEQAQNFLHAIEHCEELIYQDETKTHESENVVGCMQSECENRVAEDPVKPPITTAQRRADAAVLLAERSLALRGEHLAQSDRFQVVLNIDNSSLTSCSALPLGEMGVPSRKPFVEGVGPIPTATARRIACDCSIIKIVSDDGEPLSIGRKQRIWTPSLRRVILTRDRHCQFPGCTSHRFLHIHHIKHWADGGETSVDNGVCLCQFHHQLVHMENYTITRFIIENGEHITTGFISSTKKKLLPTRCRFVFKRLPKDQIDRTKEGKEKSNESPGGDFASINGSNFGAIREKDNGTESEFIQRARSGDNKRYTVGVTSRMRNSEKDKCDEHSSVYQYHVKLYEQIGLHT